MNAPRALATAGFWGAILTLVILAMSVLLRLGTQLEGGIAVSTLPADVELWARIAHRIAAMGVGILAALAFVAAWKSGTQRSRRAVGMVVGLTLVLAVVGRYTPGYRFDVVTVINVAGGVALAAAFWTACRRDAGSAGDAVALGALILLLVLAAVGAAIDAAAMRGERAFGPLHLFLGAIFACLALAAAWRGRERGALAASVVVLTVSQLALGLALVAAREARPLALGWAHAMIACALALCLVSLARPARVGGP